MPNSMLMAMAAPSTSATSVEMAANTAEAIRKRPVRAGRWRVAASERHSPVAMPRCAALCCSTISIRVDSVMTHSSVLPNCAPLEMFAAQLPGSMKPTVTSSPGPM